MSAPGIMYSGVLARNTAGDDANAGVFRGLKFWVSARVPQRKSCVDTIADHGGKVVLREGNADILISDEAKDPIPGSYSYRLIPEAVEEGSLDMKEDYSCDAIASRPGSSYKPAPKPKLTRTRFTEEQDRALIRFVTERERLGESTSGNDIYKEFAETHPHHTWQSWRDRWVKKFKNIVRPHVSDREQSPQPRGTPVASSPKIAAKRSPIARTRARFTSGEDDLILEVIHRAIDNHEPWNGYQPYKQLANEFPQRTYLSWRDRALNHVAKQNKDQITQWEFEAGFHPSDKEQELADNAEERQIPPVEDAIDARSEIAAEGDDNTPKRAINGSLKGNTAHHSTNGDSNEQEHQDMVSSPIHKAMSPVQLARTKPPAKGERSNGSVSSPMFHIPNLQGDEIIVTTEAQFYRDYNTFLESVGVTERRIPSIRGRAISLWDLWQTVRSKKVDNAELDWQQIAEDLGFDWVSMESVPKELQQCYEENLVPFADAMLSFNDFSDEEDSSEDDTGAESENLMPSSPPVLPFLKRPYTITSPIYIPQSSPKRRRIDRNLEIPSTPEHAASILNSRSLADSDKTPTKSRVGHSSVVQSISRSQTRPNTRKFDETAKLAEPLQGRKRRLEPETQDFNFGPDTQVYTHDEGLDDSDNDSQEGTPSQQLRLESDAISPQIQSTTPTLAASPQKIGQTTPTPLHRVRGPFQPDDDDDNDNDDRNVQQQNKSGRKARTPLSTQKAPPKRRTLPSSFVSKTPVSSKVPQNVQPSSPPVPETESHRKPSPPKETPDDVIDRFVSLGYSKDIVLRSLKATSWIIGNAGQVMEMLKQGEPLPPRTSGVWTQRDDDSLALVYSHSPPSDTKEEKKREKELKRLQAKHGDEQIALRKRYLLDELPE
ncbi:TRF2-interacting telomeric protein/Rap1 C terminal domain-containing protein [Xylaria sp. FL0064]|nr:TRF2-interacting telomeric protein/Rap1 C terminal domain-containing protein [Xylaria sp. FL0064]